MCWPLHILHHHAELPIKLLVPVKCSELANAQIAPALFLLLALFSRKEVFPVNVRLLLRVVIPHPSLKLSLDDSHRLVMYKVAVLCSNAGVI